MSNTYWRNTTDVARWEFARFFKIKELITTLLITMLSGGGFYLGAKALKNEDKDERPVVTLLNRSQTPFIVSEESPFTLGDTELDDETALRQQVTDEELDALLILDDGQAAELIVRKEPIWLDALRQALTQRAMPGRLGDAGISPAQLGALLQPENMELTLSEGEEEGAAKTKLLIAILAAGLMGLGIFTGNAYLFTAITGEKQLRITEQIIAAISPQAWIDGKILGMAGMTLIYMISLAVGSALTFTLIDVIGVNMPFTFQGISIPVIIGQLLISSLGFALWFTFFAAIAATINDPNTSGRSSFMFLPMVPLGLGFIALKNPDSTLSIILGQIPLTSPTALSIRLAVGDIAWWELPLAAVWLVTLTLLIRRAAAKIFALGVMMHGKEPSWREMITAARKS